MSYFLDDAPAPTIKAPPQRALSSYWEGFGASISASAMENDANFIAGRTRRQSSRDLAIEVFPRVGMDAAIAKAGEEPSPMGPVWENAEAPPETLDEFFDRYGFVAGADYILQAAREQAEADPEAWKGVDLSDEGVENETNARLKAEYEEAQDIAAMSPVGSVGQFLAGFVGATADIKNLPFLFAGGVSGSFLRTVGREALINTAAEGVFLPARFDMAKRLEIEDPDILRSLAEAAAFGGIFGGLFEAGARGLRYARSRRVGPSGGEPGPILREAATDAAEDAAVAGRNPFDEAERVLKAEPAEPPPVPRSPDVRPDPNRPEYVDTRGSGERFHGSRSTDLDEGLFEGSYSSQNIYGQGFYTSDAAAVSQGYNKGGGLYRVEEVAPVTAFDMEQPVPDFLRETVRDLGEYSELRDIAEEALSENPASVRQFYDKIREISDLPADEVQGLFEDFEMAFKRNGFNALDHLGGSNTKTEPHQVRIYLEPWKDIRVEKIDPDTVRVQQPAPSEPQQQPAAAPSRPQAAGSEGAPVDWVDNLGSPEATELQQSMVNDIRDQIEAEGDFEVDLMDGKGPRPASEVLDEIAQEEDFAEVIGYCVKPPKETSE